MPEEVTKAELECSYALSGAEYVRDRILSLLSMGPRNIQNSYYAIKCRIKSRDSLEDKVKRKIETESRTDYSVSDVTDVIGLRILTIFSQDLVDAAIDFLEFIRFCQQSDIKLFVGNSLDHTIEEIIVYKSSNNQSYDLVYSRLARIPLSPNRKGEQKLKLKESTPDQPYSSIHILCNAISYYDRRPKIIPVEAQIRTIFEDAWNEVDHPFRYKGLRRAAEGLSLAQRLQVKQFQDRLLNLKYLLDACGNDADQIRASYLALRESAEHDRGKIRPVAITLSAARDFNIDPASCLARGYFRDRFVELEGKATDVFSKGAGDNAFYRSQAISSLSMLAEELDRLDKEYREKQPIESEKDKDFYFYTRMEKALLHMRKGRLAKSLAGKENVVFQQELEDALNIYLDLERQPEFRDDSLLKLRMSNCLQLMGYNKLATNKMRVAAQLCQSDPRPVASGIIPVLIFRRQAVLAWREKQTVSRESGGVTVGHAVTNRERELLEEARTATMTSVELLRAAEYSGPAGATELARSYNDLISYCWDVFDAFQEKPESGSVSYLEMAEHMEASAKREELKEHQIDSLAKAYFLAGDFAKARQWLNELTLSLRRPDIHNDYGLEDLDLLKYSTSRLATALTDGGTDAATR